MATSAPTSAPYNADHLSIMCSRLIEQYKGGANFAKLLVAMSGEIQNVEDVFNDLRWLRSASLAAGQQLDELGYLVGVKRSGMIDASYRTRIQAQILLNVASGSPEDIIAITVAMTQGSVGVTIAVVEFIAAFVLRLGGIAITNATDIATVVALAKDCGVASCVEYNTDTDANSFALESTCAFLTGATIVGATAFAVSGVSGVFSPTGGSIKIDAGTANEETLAYSAFAGGSFTTAAATKAHFLNSTVQLVGSVGLGYGDTANGATGGSLAGAI